MMTQFPPLSTPPPAITDPGTVRLGDSCITAKYPPITRRGLLRTTALIPAAVAVAMIDGCSAITTAIALAPEIATYAGTIAQGISLVLPTIKTLTGLAGGAYDTIAWLATEIENAARGLTTATVSTASSLVTTVGSDLGTIAGKLSGLPGLPTLVDDVISNALALYTGIETKLFGAPVVTAPPPAAMHRFAARAATLTPEQAFENMKAILAQHGIRL